MYHIISFCIHYKCKHKKQVFLCTTWTLKSLYNTGQQIEARYVTNRAGSQIEAFCGHKSADIN